MVTTEHVAVRMPVAELENLDREAEKNHTTRSAVIIDRIRKGEKPKGRLTLRENILLAILTGLLVGTFLAAVFTLRVLMG